MKAKALPGEPSYQQWLESALRVDHAGEYGAQQIYKGQLAVLGKDACAPMLQEMKEQEEAHLAKFEELLPQRNVRPTALLPFWHIAGYALGAGSALLGKKAAMACTVAVEDVIAEHYQQQIERIDESDSELQQTLTQFRDDEMEHHDTGLSEGAEQLPFYEVFSAAIKAGCHAAIWLSKRV